MTETTFNQNRIFNYGECEMPTRMAFDRRAVEWQRDTLHILKEWGVSNLLFRKKCRPRLQKARIRFQCGLPYKVFEAHSQVKLWTVEPLKSGSKRAVVELGLISVFDDLLDLQRIEDVGDEYILRPTERAFSSTKLKIKDVFNRMGGRFPIPRIVPDGEGGLVAVWLRNNRKVRLRFRAESAQQDYVYYQTDDIYDVEDTGTDTLVKRLGWLLRV